MTYTTIEQMIEKAVGQDLWSLVRSVMCQGMSINDDYHHGKRFASYEEYSARIDEAARERAEGLLALIRAALTAQAGDGNRSTSWLIECIASPSPLWFTGLAVQPFHADANEAVHFPSKEAAQNYFELNFTLPMKDRLIKLHRDCYGITEHEFVAQAGEKLPVDDEEERQRFEAFVKRGMAANDGNFLERNPNGSYKLLTISAGWAAWQARPYSDEKLRAAIAAKGE